MCIKFDIYLKISLKKVIKIKRAIAVILVLAFCFGLYIGIQPDKYSFYTDEQISSGSPFIRLDMGSAQTSKSLNAVGTLNQGRYKAKVKLFGVLPIKTAEISVLEKKDIIPLGTAFGVKLYTDGVIVVDITDFVHDGAVQNPAYAAGIREGDIILSYNGVQIKSNEELMAQVKLFDGKPQKAVVLRNNLKFEVDITPVKDDTDGRYRIGLWVRDSTAGIGMLTYYDKSSNILAGLGHSISDNDTGLIMPVSTGELVRANIEGVVKGASGAPGELLGSFDESSVIGVLTGNSNTGLTATCVTDEFSSMKSYPIALKDEITTGKAQIISCVDGSESKYYDIEVVKINNNLQETKNMVIKITDSDLLDRTGGIVQGMSGSPIIQNGKIIGAVTHVLVSDPQKGYAIFIENMLTSS